MDTAMAHRAEGGWPVRHMLTVDREHVTPTQVTSAALSDELGISMGDAMDPRKAMLLLKAGYPDAEQAPDGYCPSTRHPGAGGNTSWVHCTAPFSTPSR